MNNEKKSTNFKKSVNKQFITDLSLLTFLWVRMKMKITPKTFFIVKFNFIELVQWFSKWQKLHQVVPSKFEKILYNGLR